MRARDPFLKVKKLALMEGRRSRLGRWWSSLCWIWWRAWRYKWIDRTKTLEFEFRCFSWTASFCSYSSLIDWFFVDFDVKVFVIQFVFECQDDTVDFLVTHVFPTRITTTCGCVERHIFAGFCNFLYIFRNFGMLRVRNSILLTEVLFCKSKYKINIILG